MKPTVDIIRERSLSWGKVANKNLLDTVTHSSPLATKAESSKPWVIVRAVTDAEGRRYVELEAQQ